MKKNRNKKITLLKSDNLSAKKIFFLIFIPFIILFWKLFFSPPASGDFISQFYTFGNFNKQYFLSHFNLPFWNPFIGCGSPNLDMGFGYNILYLLFVYMFPLDLGVGIGYALIVLMGGIFAYIFFNSLKLNKYTAIIGSIIYMLSGDMVSYLYPGHLGKPIVMAFIPLILFFINRGLSKEKYYYFIFAGAGMGFQYLAHPQIFYYSLIMISIYFGVEVLHIYKESNDKKRLIKDILFFAVMGITAGLITFNQLVEQYSYSKLTSRGTVVNPDEAWAFATSWSSHPLELLTFFVPSLFGLYDSTYIGWKPFVQTTDYFGMLTILLAVIGAVVYWKNRKIKFFVFFAFFSLLFGLGKFFPAYYKIFYNYVPLIKKFRVPVSIYLVTTFSIVFLAFYGLNALLERKKSLVVRNVFILFFIIYIAITLWVNSGSYLNVLANNLIARAHLDLTKVSIGRIHQHILTNIVPLVTTELFRLWVLLIVFAVVVYWFYIKKIKIKNFIIVVAIIIFIDLFFIDKKFIKTVPNYDLVAKKTDVINFLQEQYKTDKFRISPIPASINNESNKWQLYNIESAFVYNAIGLKRWDDALKNRWFGNLKLLGLMNVKYLVAKQRINHPDLKLVFSGTKFVYENKYFLPRIMLFDKYKVIKESKRILAYMGSNLFKPTNEIILEKEPVSDAFDKTGSSVKLSKWNYDEFEIKADIKNKSILFVSEVYYPKWRCYINNKEVKIYKADYLFRAVILPKGKYKVKFEFYNSYFYLISAIFHYLITLLILYLIIVKLKHKKI